jgi:hypothetical protein
VGKQIRAAGATSTARSFRVRGVIDRSRRHCRRRPATAGPSNNTPRTVIPGGQCSLTRSRTGCHRRRSYFGESYREGSKVKKRTLADLSKSTGSSSSNHASKWRLRESGGVPRYAAFTPSPTFAHNSSPRSARGPGVTDGPKRDYICILARKFTSKFVVLV